MIVSLPSTKGCRGWPELFCTTPWLLQQNTGKGSSLKELFIYQVCVKLPPDSPTSLYPRRASEQINNAEIWVLASKTHSAKRGAGFLCSYTHHQHACRAKGPRHKPLKKACQRRLKKVLLKFNFSTIFPIKYIQFIYRPEQWHSSFWLFCITSENSKGPQRRLKICARSRAHVRIWLTLYPSMHSIFRHRNGNNP